MSYVKRNGQTWLEEELSPDLIWAIRIKDVLHSSRSKFQKVELADSGAFKKLLMLDGKAQSAEADEYVYHELLTHPALLLHGNPKTVFIAGGGEGATAREVLKHSSVTKVVMVDIDEVVTKFCKEHLTANTAAFDDPRLELIHDDARAQLEHYPGKFDVIIGDLADPVEGGPCYQLYTQEFYETVIKAKLNPGGVFVTQSGPAGVLSSSEVFAPINNTLRQVFPQVVPYAQHIPSFVDCWGWNLATVDPNLKFPSASELDQHIKTKVNGELKFLDGAALLAVQGLNKPVHLLRSKLLQSGTVVSLEEADLAMSWLLLKCIAIHVTPANMQTLPKESTNGIAVLSATAHSQDHFSDQVTTNALSKDVKKAKAPPKRFIRQQIPDEILKNEGLNQALKVLPINYNFEIHKTVWRIKQAKAAKVALQFPEGLLMYACIISDILERFAGVEHCFILGEVTYGACCVDDFSARALGAEFLVHYGHSCLVPVDVMPDMPSMYVFVDIKIDVQHLVDTVRLNFPAGQKLILAGTIQFGTAVQSAKRELANDYPSLAVPQSRPLSPGEVLGCTAPIVMPDSDAIIFIADGRFHLEAIMIANPEIPAFKYDPYARQMTAESYDHEGMRSVRKNMIQRAEGCQRWGLILGTLGRQGNPQILETLKALLDARGLQHTLVLLSEVAPWKLEMMDHVDAWIQIACPRLSIDWGEGFSKPTLTPYEAMIAFKQVQPFWEQRTAEDKDLAYPMDYYARDGGPWNSHWKPKSKR